MAIVCVTIKKRKGEMGQPCGIPLFILNLDVVPCDNLIELLQSLYSV